MFSDPDCVGDLFLLDAEPDPDSETDPDPIPFAISKTSLTVWKLSPSLQMVTAGKLSSVTGLEMVFRFVIV